MGGITNRRNLGNNSGDTPTVGAVSFQTPQVLTAEQKTQAQSNINAVGIPAFDGLLDSLGNVKRDIRLVYMNARQIV